MDGEEISKFDQDAAFLGDVLPPLWKRLYDRCLEVGFSEEQAFLLVRTYVFGAAGGKLER